MVRGILNQGIFVTLSQNLQMAMLKRRVIWVCKQDLRRCRRTTWIVYKMARKCRYQTCECAGDVSHNEVEVVVDGRDERCQTLTTPSLRRPQVQSPTALIVVWASISSRLADFMLSRQCGIDEKTRMSGPYDRQTPPSGSTDIPTTSWHLSILDGI